MVKKYWFDSNGLLYPAGENGILFTAEFARLMRNFTGMNINDLVIKAIKSQMLSDNEFRASDTPLEPWSHDNHTAVVCVSKQMNLEYHKKTLGYKGFWRTALHPRDFVFYHYAKGGLSSVIAWFFLWIPMITMIITCLQDHKTRNGVKILKTDGKLLTWLRLQTFFMPITRFLCNLAIKHNKEFRSWKNCFAIYFKDPKHPNNDFKGEVYEIQVFKRS